MTSFNQNFVKTSNARIFLYSMWEPLVNFAMIILEYKLRKWKDLEPRNVLVICWTFVQIPQKSHKMLWFANRNILW